MAALIFVDVSTPQDFEPRRARRQIRARAATAGWRMRHRQQSLEDAVQRQRRQQEGAYASEDTDVSTTEAFSSEWDYEHDIYVPTSLDPFYVFPVPYQPWMPWMVDYLKTVFFPRGWSAFGLTSVEGVAWSTQSLRQAMTEPAMFYMQLFTASGALLREGRITKELEVWLRGETVRCINEALDDPARALSTPLIHTVGRIAIHECLYGDVEAARLIHRPAYRRMIVMRGGVAAMGVSDFVVRLMDWTDRIMFIKCGPPDDRLFVPFLNKDITRGALDIQVVNQYVPNSLEG
ncbi:hypothetical protein LTR56_020716 [Elasticomyces elasticus]|nr:hypothetical protein LTR56_020716 [Elasticomyces elasticus]KAK3632601.1 hypothetical protein LTR22_020537 [Elasticomyces elasticus]KAK4914954.1 hypothetical protein LTR49_016819 [Elasticomyces elasticus]KAK5748643.1 hypothetical protein LTS12_021276 [Elasticomyces elasticus]